mgnify:CR=1 FL=1
MPDFTELEKQLVEAVAELEEDKVLQLAEKALTEGMEPLTLLQAVNKGMQRVGELYEEKTYFIADLIMAGLIFKEVLGLKPIQKLFYAKNKKKIGKLVLGTVQGDLHDIGKDIFRGLMETNNFEVIDLGVDVPAEKFVRKTLEHKPDIVGMSGVLTYTVDAMKEVVEALKEAEIRDSVKVIVGGGHLTEASCKFIGADAYSNDAFEGVKLCLQWMKTAKQGEE